MKEVLKKRLNDLLGLPVLWDCPLKNYTSFHIGGPAEALVQVQSLEELGKLLQIFQESEVSWRVIGRGTNLLIGDEGFPGVVLVLSGALEVLAIKKKEDMILLDAGAGHSLTKLSAICGASGFSGLEFAMGIPGSVGGAVVMNAGAWGQSMADVLVSVSIMTAKGIKTFGEQDLKFTYRKWLNLPDNDNGVVTSAKIRLVKGDSGDIRRVSCEYREKRKTSQPVGLANAGSIFRNPTGDSAGRLIEASGLKGKRVGGAEVSVKHANFIVNIGDATASDVFKLMAIIQEVVKKDSGIFLEPEVHIL